jgi:hypothetical protein
MRDWINLLSIASRYDFQRIRDCAISAIDHRRWPRWNEGIDPIERIVLAEKHDIPEWLPIAYADLCQRPNPLEEWEGEKLGYRKLTLLARAREAVRNPEHTPEGPSMATPVQTAFPIFTPEPDLDSDVPPDDFYRPYSRSRVNAIVKEVFS